jgi:hypothetical protein
VLAGYYDVDENGVCWNGCVDFNSRGCRKASPPPTDQQPCRKSRRMTIDLDSVRELPMRPPSRLVHVCDSLLLQSSGSDSDSGSDLDSGEVAAVHTCMSSAPPRPPVRQIQLHTHSMATYSRILDD